MKHIIIMISILFFSINIYSQKTQNESVELSLGYEFNGYLAKFSYNRNIGMNGMFRLGGQFNYEILEQETAEDLIVNLYIINLEYYHNIWTINQGDFIVSVGLGLAGGYENVSEEFLSNGFVVNNESGSFYGGHFGAEFDKYLTSTNEKGNFLSLIGNVREYYLPESTIGDLQFNASIGIRYNF